MKKILVTGAGGYIGRHVVQTLLQNDEVQVIAVSLDVDSIDKRAERIGMDLFSGNKNIFKELGEPDVCIHMAWKDGFVHNSDTHMLELSKHYEFIKNMIDGGLRHLVVMGTMHEVGYYEGAIDENTPCNPRSMYGIAKDALRRSIFQMIEGKEIVFQWLRAYYICGDDKLNNSIFAKIIAAAEDGKKTFPFTTGKNKYDFIDVQELSKQIVSCALQAEVNGVINCCTGKPISLAEKVEEFIRKNNFDIKLEYGVYPDRAYDSKGVWGNTDKINKIMQRSK